ncbi:MAG: hypothetical protein FRX49_01984 [Trebouxia sp. A1-2]|nr:MAG: hypothetical protein FRX49_01984 [Trebouxia sp. A1-2]
MQEKCIHKLYLQSWEGLKDNKKAEPELSPQDKKGQRTAIITGFISVAFGVAYLLLVSLLDSRGNVLHPPPPEAFGL